MGHSRLLITFTCALVLISLRFFALPARQHSQLLRTQSHDNNGQKLAFATFLSTRTKDENEEDTYFTAARVLTYQLLHHPTTRTNLNIPLLILTSPHVPQRKRDALSREGATIIPVEPVSPETNWLAPTSDKWVDQFSKLRILELTEYDRILYMDSDMLITRCLDDIFNEPVAQEVQYTKNISSEIKEDEGNLPSTYLFAGVSNNGGAGHGTPPIEGVDINGGFWLTRPDPALFAFYRRILEIPFRFDSAFMEQSLLTYVHRRDGNMPWRAFEMGRWNSNWPTAKDLEYGTATLHDKFWDEANEAWIDRKPVEMWRRMEGATEGYWLRDAEEKLH